jgi:type IV secretory pathway TrbD component
MLPQFILLTAMSVALWLASRWVNKEALRVDAQMRSVEVRVTRAWTQRAPLLRQDPETGRYFPVRI